MRQLLLIICVLGTQSLVFGQVQKISMEYNAVKLTRVFKQLERKYGLKIAYDVKLVSSKKVTVKLINRPIDEALDKLLEGTGLDFLRSGKKHIAVYPSKDPINNEANLTIYNYQGWVLDSESGDEIPFAKIKIVGTNLGTYADESGKFSLKTTRKQFELEISTIGFLKRKISSTSLHRKRGNKIELILDILDYPEVVVEYLAEGMTVSKDVSEIEIRPDRIGTTAGTTDPDVFMTIQGVPGINSANETVSEMQIRGGTSDQNHILWEGITLFHPGHFNGMFSSINPTIIDRAKIHRGSYDPYFGGRASGLIELMSMTKLPKKAEWEVGSNLLYTDGYYKTPIKKNLGLMISARRSFVDLIKTPTYKRYAQRIYQESEIRQESYEFVTLPDSSIVENEIGNVFYFLDVNSKLLYQPRPGRDIAVSFLLTNNDLYYESYNNVDLISKITYFNTRNFGGSINWKEQITDKWKSDIVLAFSSYSYYFQNDYTEKEVGQSYSFSEIKTNGLSNISWRLRNDFQLNKHHKLSAGYQGEYYNVGFSVTEFENLISQYADTGSTFSWLNSLHINHTWENGKWLSKIGSRFSHFGLDNQIYFGPRGTVQYSFNKTFTATAGGGMQNQFVSQVEDIDQAQHGLSNRVWVLADNDEVPVIRSQSVNAGIVARWKGWYFEIDGYVKDIIGISNFADNKNLSSGFDRGSAHVIGADFLVQKRWKGWRTWLSYTLSDVTYTFDGLSTSTFEAPFNQPHVVKWINTITWRNFKLATSLKIASGKRYTQALGLIDNPEGDPLDDDITDDYLIEYTDFNSSPLPIYHRLDLTLLYTLVPKNKEAKWNLKFGVSLLNIYDQKNYLSRTYRLDFSEDEAGDDQADIITVDRFYLRFTTNILVRFQFN